MQFSLLAFDLDGTLADTESIALPDAVDMFNTEYNVPVTLEYWYANYHGVAGQTLLNRIAEDFGVTIALEDFFAARARRIEKVFANGVNPAPGMLQVLRTLVAQGRQLCICSNSQRERIALTLTNLKGQHSAGLMLPQVFEGHVFSAIDGETKPHPYVYTRAAGHYGTQPSQCLAVEDSATGVKAAVAAGYTCVGYTGLATHPEQEAEKMQKAGAAHIFTHWDDFPHLLTQLEVQ